MSGLITDVANFYVSLIVEAISAKCEMLNNQYMFLLIQKTMCGIDCLHILSSNYFQSRHKKKFKIHFFIKNINVRYF